MFWKPHKTPAPEAAEVFCDKYIKLICFLVNKYAPEGASREDLIQETWLHLLEHMETLRSLTEQQTAGYIGTTVKRLCWHSREKAEEELDESRLPDMGADAQAQLAARELIAALPAAERQLLVLRYVFGYSIEELARTYRATPGSIRTRISRARARLKQAAGKEEAD